MSSKQLKGQSGERLAEDYLCKQGLKLITRNYHCRQGEVDLIMELGSEIIFVEVRSRGPGSLASAAESVTPAKQRKLSLAALHYLDEHKLHQKHCRFDVVAITVQNNGKAEVEWLTNAFEAHI